MNYIERMGERAKACKGELANASTAQKNEALLEIAHALRRNKDKIKEANACDIKAAAERGMPAAMQDTLNQLNKNTFMPMLAAFVRAETVRPHLTALLLLCLC